MNNYTVRALLRTDSERFLEITNHPKSRQFSNSHAVIPFDHHDAWFADKYFSGQDNHCFVIENAWGEMLGYCRFDANDSHYVVSINIDPIHGGHGLGHKLLSDALRRFDGFNLTKPIVAEIHRDNIASLKLFKKNGFAVFDDDWDVHKLNKEKTIYRFLKFAA